MVSLTQTRLALGAAAFVLLAALTTLAPAQARAKAPGRFDYYVLALSWSPSYCARAGRKEPEQIQEEQTEPCPE